MQNEDIFIKKWNVNGEDLIEQGVYDEALSMLEDYDKILEIGCGTGYSTLAISLKFHKVFAIDRSEKCIKEAEKRLANIGCEIVENYVWSNEEVTLLNDEVQEIDDNILGLEFDTVVLWNPGQTREGHNDKITDLCSEIAKKKNVPFQLMERVLDKKAGKSTLKEIADSNELELIEEKYIQIKWNNKEGVKLGDENYSKIYIAIGLFVKKDNG